MSVDNVATPYSEILERAVRRDRHRVAIFGALWFVAGLGVLVAARRWTSQLDGLQGKVEHLRSEVKTIQGQSETTRREAVRAVAEATALISRVQGPISELKAVVDRRSNELIDLQDRQRQVDLDLKNQLDARGSDVEQMAGRVSKVADDLTAAERKMAEVDQQLITLQRDLESILRTARQTFRTNRWDPLAGSGLFFGLGNWKSGEEGLTNFCVSAKENGPCLPLKASTGATLGPNSPLPFRQPVQLAAGPCLYTIVAKSGTRIQFSRADLIEFDVRCEPLAAAPR